MARIIRINDILDAVASYHPEADFDFIRKAYVYSAMVHRGQFRLSGRPYLSHPIEVAYILTQLKQGVPAIAAGLLHDSVEDTLATIDDIRENFGDEVTLLVDGLTKIAKIEFSTKKQAQAENFRKILLAMSEDIRIILIKLADRLHNMRTIEYLTTEKQQSVAQETLDIYAPLANRMGIFWLKSELEDLCLKALKPDIYHQIDDQMSARHKQHEKYIEEIGTAIKETLAKHGLQAEVIGRLKHIYSIYHKMEVQNVEFDQVYDIIAFRVIVDTVRACYEALGIINNMWTPIPGRMKDFIALPKANMYQSYHTTVIGLKGKHVEIQIRTWEMHMVAEEGIAAHWRYKDDGQIIEKDETAFAWLRQMLEWQRDTKDAGTFLESVKLDLFPEEVYVFTPKGDVKVLPRGSTPVDFAFSIHTEVGNHTTGAKINGKIVPLRYQLSSGDQVEILTSKKGHPSKDWLKFVKTPRSRQKIHRWVTQKEMERSKSLGREILEKGLRRYGRSLGKLEKAGEMDQIASRIGLNNGKQVFAQIGYGKISKDKVIGLLLPEEEIRRVKEGKKPSKSVLGRLITRKTRQEPAGVRIDGIDDIMVRFAKCCEPLPGDDIAGYITRGRGITVHRSDCPRIITADTERLIDVEWKEGFAESHPVRINIVCVDKPGLLASMSNAISNTGINISRAEARSSDDLKANCIFEFNVQSLNELRRVIKNVEKVKGVIHVERMRTTPYSSTGES